jgi:uncharacterized membrane protein (DUF2068 family)
MLLTVERRGVRVVAGFEAAKGLLVLLAGFELLSFIHKDLHRAAEQLVRQFHLNPARRFPRIFLDLADHVNDGQLWLLAAFALLYAAVRFVEAFGLWRGRTWAEWFGMITGAMYIPIEVLELLRGVTWPKATVLVVNTIIAGYLAAIVFRARRERTG